MTALGQMRAPLFVPATRPERFAKAAASGADAVILDLEDAVAAADKAGARAALRRDFWDGPVIVRINGVGTSWHEDDMAAVAALAPDAVMLPKAEDPAAVAAVHAASGLPLIALVESAAGLAAARAIAATQGVARLAFGSVDFCADLGCEHVREALTPARAELTLASRLARIAAPLDGVTLEVADGAAAHDDALHARAMGMTGKLCIHPRQAPEVLRAFAPSAAQIDWARRVLASGDGAVAVDGQMVDEPVRARARAILAAMRG